MSKSVKVLLIILSAAALVSTCIWYYYSRTWEPFASICGSFAVLIGTMVRKVAGEQPQPLVNQNIENNQTVHVHGLAEINGTSGYEKDRYDLDKRKKITNILFVDDDTKFRVVSILKKAGWTYTKAVKDIGNLDELFVKESHIIFVDVQGVGKLLQTRDEGLGLALILKRKYPDKKIVIYSAQTEGDRFHEALRKADAFLPKNAEPYEFQQLVEQYSEELIK